MSATVQEIRIISVEGLAVPDGLAEGSRFTVTCELLISKVDQEWVDVTQFGGKPQLLPGSLILGCVATEWTAA